LIVKNRDVLVTTEWLTEHLSDADLRAALQDADVSAEVTTAALEVNSDARVAGLRSALAVLALIALLGLFSARRIPSRPPQSPTG